jgi:hypothetical protein
VFQNGNEVVPPHRVEGFRNVEFDEQGRRFCYVKPHCQVTHVEEVVMDVAPLDESTLAG